MIANRQCGLGSRTLWRRHLETFTNVGKGDNGVRYVLDVKTIMFSRGNIKEKLRVADFKCRVGKCPANRNVLRYVQLVDGFLGGCY